MEVSNLSELMELIYTDIRTLIYGKNILSTTTEIMGDDIALEFVDIPAFRKLVTEKETKFNDNEALITNLHGQTILMLSVLLNVECGIIPNLLAVDDFGLSALDYSNILTGIGGYVKIVFSEDVIDVHIQPFDNMTRARHERIKNKLLEFERYCDISEYEQ